MKVHRTRLRQVLVGVLFVALLVGSAGCTGSDESPREPAAPSLPDRSVGTTPTLEAKPVPMRVTVGREVGGKLRKRQRRLLEKQVKRVLSAYFDEAYLGGEYPRTDFSGALSTFSRGVPSRAASDREVLTNAGIGGDTEAIVPRVKQARLDVLVPRRNVVGLTARVRLVFLQQRADGVDRVVTVKGRLMMNRKRSGPWQIFGYDVVRSAVPARKGGRR